MDFIIPIVLFIVIFGIFYVYITARNRERMAIIEKGTEFDLSIFENKRKFDFRGLLFRLGLLSVGVGFGVVIAIIIEALMFDTIHQRVFSGNIYCYTQDNAPALFISMIFIFGGLGLILGFFLGRKKEN